MTFVRLVLLAAGLLVAAVAAFLFLPGGGPAAPGPAAVPAGAAEERVAAARQTAEDRLRSRLRIEGPLTLRAVQTWPQALPDTLAVCGQINPSGRGDEPFIPYVAVVGFEGARAARAELFLGASSQEAARVYIELLDKCFEGGGPPAGRASLRPLPPVPSELPRAVPPPPPAAATPPTSSAPSATPPLAAVPSAPVALTPATGPASGTVTTTSRHPVNVRASPTGGGAVLRTVPRGSSLQVFGEAPGGWLQVGEAEPWGWLHASMLEGR